jgi:hypothetical protein
MQASVSLRPVSERALEALRRAGNPFRNCFARNPDDDICRRYHVPELFSAERDQLLAVVDVYRSDATSHSEIVPVLGNKGSGKTHLLHSIKHGRDGAWQMLVTPGTFHKESDFLEYLLFQIIDTLLGGGKQKGTRPLEYVGEQVARSLLRQALSAMSHAQRLQLVPASGVTRWARRFGFGASDAKERSDLMLEAVGQGGALTPLHRLCGDLAIDVNRVHNILTNHISHLAGHDTAGLMRKRLLEGLVQAVLRGDESELAGFLTYGFAELGFQVRPGRQELVLGLLKVLMQCFLDLRTPVVVAFDQLEDLLLSRRSDDGRKTAEAFFAGIVHAMHQVDGLCFLVFAERGLWNRFIPSLDGYIQDRLNNPIHLPAYGTIKTIRLEAPPPDLVRRIVEARLRSTLEQLPDVEELSPIFPFTDDQVQRIARAEPTLRDMLQQFRQLFDRLVYETRPTLTEEMDQLDMTTLPLPIKSVIVVEASPHSAKVPESPAIPQSLESSMVEHRWPAVSGPEAIEENVVEPAGPHPTLLELWEQETGAGRRQLHPDGALAGATRELQGGLAKLLQFCHEQGIKVGPWRLTHVMGEMSFGDHPAYGVVTLAHWACKDSQPWRVGMGLFLGRGPGKLKDLETKLAALDAQPQLLDYLILLRPDDDLALSGKSKALWQDAERRGRHARLEPLGLDAFAALYAFPRWLAAVNESQTLAEPAPDLADFVQEHCDRLLEQLCMPVQQ